MSVYGFGATLSRLIQFLLLPVYTRFLSPADYGSLEIISIAGSMLAILFGFMIGSGFIRNYYDNQENLYRRELMSTAFWFTFSTSLIFSLLLLYFSSTIARSLFHFENSALYLRLITISTFFIATNQIFYNLLMVQSRARTFVTINIITLVTTLISAIFLVVYLNWSVKGVLAAQLVGLCIESVILFFVISEEQFHLFSIRKTAEMLKYALPLIPLQIASFVLELSDRFFLQHYQDMSDIGLYSFGYKFAAIVPLLTIQPLRGFTPYIFSLIDTPEKCKQTLAKIFRYFTAGILSLTLCISIFSREAIMLVADRSYLPSWRFVFVLCFSYVFYGLVVLISYSLEIVKKNWISGFFWAIAAAINILLNILLIPRLGAMGAAVATTLSYLFILLCYFLAISRVYYVPFEYSKFLLIMLLTVITYYLSTYLHFGLFSSLLAKSALLMTYFFTIYFCGYFTPSEIRDFKSGFADMAHKAAQKGA